MKEQSFFCARASVASIINNHFLVIVMPKPKIEKYWLFCHLHFIAQVRNGNLRRDGGFRTAEEQARILWVRLRSLCTNFIVIFAQADVPSEERKIWKTRAKEISNSKVFKLFDGKRQELRKNIAKKSDVVPYQTFYMKDGQAYTYLNDIEQEFDKMLIK
jgi:hypothetical protein